MKPTPAYISPKTMTLFYCWCAYALAYTLRVNIAVVIPFLRRDIGYSNTQLGMVTSLFFLTYTVGQLVNGYLGDRVNSKILIVGGLASSAAFNIGMGFSGSLAALAVFWGLNGLVQSMLWGPIIKTLSVWFEKRQLERASFMMSVSMILGYAVSWGASSLISEHLNWRAAFIAPALLMLIYTAVLAIFFKSKPAQPINAVETEEKKPEAFFRVSLLEFCRIINMPCLFLVAVSQGIIREGIGVWFPTILQDSGIFPADAAWRILILVPFVNFCGLLFVRYINEKLERNSFRTLLAVFLLSCLLAVLLAVTPSKWITAVLVVMVLLLSITYGLTPILTASIPFEYSRYRWVSFTAGIIDFSIYLGATLSGILSGIIADHNQWNGVILMWLAAAATGLLVMLYLNIKIKREAKA